MSSEDTFFTDDDSVVECNSDLSRYFNPESSVLKSRFDIIFFY